MALYDPNEFSETKVVSPDFTLEDVLAWARTKPADEAYPFESTLDCAMCRFLRETGVAAKPFVTYNIWVDDASLRLYGYLDERIKAAARAKPHTFGAFVDRLEQALSQ